MESLARVVSAAGRGRTFLLTRFRENHWPELAEIYTARSLGCFLLLISFLPRSVTFDLLSNVKYTKNVLVLVTAVSGEPPDGIGQNLYHALFGVFSFAD